MVREVPGKSAYLISLAKGFYPVQRKVVVLVTGDSLQIATSRERTTVPLEDIKELDLESWPNALLAFGLFILIPWSSLAIGNLSNLNLRTSSGWYHLKVRRRRERDEIVDELLSRGVRLAHVISRVEY